MFRVVSLEMRARSPEARFVVSGERVMDLLAMIDALDEKLGSCADLSARQSRARRIELSRFRQNVAADLSSGANLTSIQAQQQNAVDRGLYLPLRDA